MIDRKNELILLIENKIGAGEGPGWAARYLKEVRHEFPSFKLVPVFLTLEGESGEDENADEYITYSHASVLEVLERIIDQRRSQMPEAVVTFLNQYRDTLRRLTMQDKDLVELCQKIYRRHKDAIKLIVENGEINSFRQIASEIIVRNGDCEILKTAPTMLWFIPNSWANVVPQNENSDEWAHLPKPFSVACWIQLQKDKNRIELVFQVSSMADRALRQRCVKALREDGFKLRPQALKEDAVYSRFYGDRSELQDLSDEEEIRDAITRLLGKAREKFAKATPVLECVFSTKH